MPNICKHTNCNAKKATEALNVSDIAPVTMCCSWCIVCHHKYICHLWAVFDNQKIAALILHCLPDRCGYMVTVSAFPLCSCFDDGNRFDYMHASSCVYYSWIQQTGMESPCAYWQLVTFLVSRAASFYSHISAFHECAGVFSLANCHRGRRLWD